MVNILVDIGAGLVSGAIASTLTAPTSKIKLSLQNQHAWLRYPGAPQMQPYSGIWNCIQCHCTELGFRSLWRGNLAKCLIPIPKMGSNLMFKDSIKRMFPVYSPTDALFKFSVVQAVAGGFAALPAIILSYPLEHARTILGTDIGKVRSHDGIIACVKNTVRHNGVRGLYAGCIPAALAIVTQKGIMFGLMDTMKVFNPYLNEQHSVALMSKLMVAQFAVIVSSFIVYPFDTLNKRLQIDASKPTDQKLYKGMTHCARTILKQHGIRGLYGGALFQLMTGVGCSVLLVGYDELKHSKK